MPSRSNVRVQPVLIRLQMDGVVESFAGGYWCVRTGPGLTDVQHLRPSDFYFGPVTEGLEVALGFETTSVGALWKGFRRGDPRLNGVPTRQRQTERSIATLATCIGCGCDDLHACLTPAPCHWLRLDRTQQLGVCSACQAHVARWDEGDRVRHHHAEQ